MSLTKNFKVIATSWILVFLILILFSGFAVFYSRDTILDFAISDAEGRLLSIANSSVIRAIKQSNITYDDISVISRDKDNNIKGIEINSIALDTLKCDIYDSIYDFTSKLSVFDVNIPLSTLVSRGYYTGYGPKINFKMIFTSGAEISFESKFTDTGINQTLHQIIVNITLSGRISGFWKSKYFNRKTQIIVAQTVIVGTVPESFTNVIDAYGTGITDGIFKYDEK